VLHIHLDTSLLKKHSTPPSQRMKATPPAPGLAFGGQRIHRSYTQMSSMLIEGRPDVAKDLKLAFAFASAGAVLLDVGMCAQPRVCSAAGFLAVELLKNK
jgi:hypothetical protein